MTFSLSSSLSMVRRLLPVSLVLGDLAIDLYKAEAHVKTLPPLQGQRLERVRDMALKMGMNTENIHFHEYSDLEFCIGLGTERFPYRIALKPSVSSESGFFEAHELSHVKLEHKKICEIYNVGIAIILALPKRVLPIATIAVVGYIGSRILQRQNEFEADALACKYLGLKSISGGIDFLRAFDRMEMEPDIPWEDSTESNKDDVVSDKFYNLQVCVSFSLFHSYSSDIFMSASLGRTIHDLQTRHPSNKIRVQLLNIYRQEKLEEIRSLEATQIKEIA